MAGLSRRFTEAGFDRPKYMLRAHGRSVFAHAVGSFAAHFGTLPFLFILRDVQGMSYEHIAEITFCSLGTVKSRVSRARMKFKDAYSRLTGRNVSR